VLRVTANPLPDVAVRDATPADLPAVAAIYTHYVLNTTITFNTQVRTPREWMDQYEAEVADGPYDLLVATVGEQVSGFIETQPFRPKPAYGRSVELTVYVAPDATGTGVGGRLFTAMLERLDASDFHRAYSVIALPNDGSIAIHERFGFTHRGTLTEAGHKFGRWLDVAFYERDLDAPRARGDLDGGVDATVSTGEVPA
jgi:phosphinothricin acetyltransferase